MIRESFLQGADINWKKKVKGWKGELPLFVFSFSIFLFFSTFLFVCALFVWVYEVIAEDHFLVFMVLWSIDVMQLLCVWDVSQVWINTYNKVVLCSFIIYVCACFLQGKFILNWLAVILNFHRYRHDWAFIFFVTSS